MPLPIIAGDKITMIGGGNGHKLEWRPSNDGIEITVPAALATTRRYYWVFKIVYLSSIRRKVCNLY